jgi:cobalt-zinc-cadmium efflux system membrane fusion protein
MSIRQSAQDTANIWLNTPLKRYGLAAIVLTTVVGGFYLNHSEPLVAPHVAEPIIQGQQLHYPANHPQLALLVSSPAKAATSVTVELPARLTWNEERTQRIYPAFAGRVQQLLVDMGQSVTPGQVLATLASPDFGAAQADTAKAVADAKVAEQARARMVTLYEADAVSKKDLELAEANWQRAKAEVARAQGKTTMYGSQTGVNQQWSLVANVRGLVVERNLSPGLEVRPEQSGPGIPALIVVSDPSSLWVHLDAREADVGSLKKGTAIRLSLPSFPGESFTAKIAATGDFIDPNTRTIKVRAVIDNTERRLKAEMLGTALIERQLPPGVMVPASAVQLHGKEHRVFVQTQTGVFEPREVKLGYEGLQDVLVVDGLKDGEQVVKKNSLLLAREYRIANEEAKTHNAQAQPAK